MLELLEIAGTFAFHYGNEAGLVMLTGFTALAFTAETGPPGGRRNRAVTPSTGHLLPLRTLPT
jgi:hypothetical protein